MTTFRLSPYPHYSGPPTRINSSKTPQNKPKQPILFPSILPPPSSILRYKNQVSTSTIRLVVDLAGHPLQPITSQLMLLLLSNPLLSFLFYLLPLLLLLLCLLQPHQAYPQTCFCCPFPHPLVLRGYGHLTHTISRLSNVRYRLHCRLRLHHKLHDVCDPGNSRLAVSCGCVQSPFPRG